LQAEWICSSLDIAVFQINFDSRLPGALVDDGVDRSLGSQKVQATLDRLFRIHGRPGFMRSDNGPEFLAQSLKDWLAKNGCQTFYMSQGRAACARASTTSD